MDDVSFGAVVDGDVRIQCSMSAARLCAGLSMTRFLCSCAFDASLLFIEFLTLLALAKFKREQNHAALSLKLYELSASLLVTCHKAVQVFLAGNDAGVLCVF